MACSSVGADVSGAGADGGSEAEALGSAKTGSSTGLLFFALLLSFAFALKVKRLVQKHEYDKHKIR